MDIKRILKEVIEKIVNYYKPQKIVLYGSYAYGKPDENSDIDLFIVKNTSKSRMERFKEVKKILWNVNNKGIPILPVIFTEDELFQSKKNKNVLISEIITSGKILYEAS